MQKDPQKMLVGKLDCLLMANGEIISAGKSLGWFNEFGKHFTPTSHADGTPVKEGEFDE